MRPVTSKELATKLGLSQATISLALRNYPKVALKTRLRVQEAAREMNYTPNRIAQAMRQSSTRLIGVIVPRVKDTYAAQLIDGVEQEADAHGYLCFIGQSHSLTKRIETQLDAFFGHQVEGMVVFPAASFEDQQCYQRLLDRGAKFVFLGHYVEGINTSFSGVDNIEAGRLAVEHLAARNHRRIAYIRGPWTGSSSRERYQGYRKGLEQAGIPFDENLVADGPQGFASGFTAIESLQERGASYTALVAYNDYIAMGALKALDQRGIKVPDDVALVGCGNLDATRLTTPSLTTIDQKASEIGRAAVRLLFKANTGDLRPQRILQQPELVVRESSTSLSSLPAGTDASPWQVDPTHL